MGEFRAVVWSEIEGWKRAKQMRVILICLSLFALLVLGANIAMAITVASAFACLCKLRFDQSTASVWHVIGPVLQYLSQHIACSDFLSCGSHLTKVKIAWTSSRV